MGSANRTELGYESRVLVLHSFPLCQAVGQIGHRGDCKAEYAVCLLFWHCQPDPHSDHHHPGNDYQNRQPRPKPTPYPGEEDNEKQLH